MKQNYKRILTIAGSDSGGCAGIQADLKVLQALNCHGSTAITAVTAQNTMGVQSIVPLTGSQVVTQIHSVLDDIGADVIKIGMLFNEEIITAVSSCLARFPYIPIILDPVCISTSKARLLEPSAINTLKTLLFPKTTLITPNYMEFLELFGENLSENNIYETMERFMLKHCLITSGDTIEKNINDNLYILESREVYTYTHSKINTQNTHGSGCSLSTAIAAFLAHNLPILKAIQQAIEFVTSSITAGAKYQLGSGPGPLRYNSCHHMN